MTDILDSPHLILPDLFAMHARHDPDRAAIVCGDRSLSWGTFDLAMNRLANCLIDLGLTRGDKVALVLDNSLETVWIIYGAARAGACIVPLSGMLTDAQIGGLIADSDAKFVIASRAFQELCAPAIQTIEGVDHWLGVGFGGDGWSDLEANLATSSTHDPGVTLTPEDDFNIIYTSGTTGLPKGIVQTHRARSHWAFSNATEMSFNADSRALTTTALYSNGTWLMLLPVLFAGGTLHVMEGFDPADWIETVQAHAITHSFMVPTQYIAVLSQPSLDGADLSSLRSLLSAGSPLRQDTKRAVLERISPRLFELYGFSEGFATLLKPHQHVRKFETVGTPVIGFEICILDDEGCVASPDQPGEIAGYGVGMMKEYYKRPDATADLIWRDDRGRSFIRSGDIGALDPQGFLTILDRKKDMIISGGFNVFPTDIETVIGEHEDVLDVTVIGVPHEKWGESALALIILEPGSAPQPDTLRDWANARLSKPQRLIGVEFREEFPRNALGKVLKRVLRDPYWE